MNRRTMALAHAFLFATLVATPSLADDDEALRKDLTAVIALQGLARGQVVAVKVQAADDYPSASCLIPYCSSFLYRLLRGVSMISAVFEMFQLFSRSFCTR